MLLESVATPVRVVNNASGVVNPRLVILLKSRTLDVRSQVVRSQNKGDAVAPQAAPQSGHVGEIAGHVLHPVDVKDIGVSPVPALEKLGRGVGDNLRRVG